MDLNKWKIFQELDPIFAADVRRAYLIGLKINAVQGRLNNYIWRGGLMVTRNGDVYSIALTSKDVELLGIEGDGTSLPLVPVRLDQLCGQEIKVVDSGVGHVLLSTADRLYQWGSIKSGKGWTCLKPQELVSSNFDNKRVVDFACGQVHTLAVTEQGEVYSWGCNIYGQLGNGSEASHTDPVKISGSNGFDNKIVSVACGAQTSFAVDNEGNVWSWGQHFCGALGYATTELQLIPKRIQNITVKKIAVGTDHAVALSNANEVYSWGCHGNENRIIVTPVKIVVQNVVDIAAMNGCRISALKTADGQVYFWGFAYGVFISAPAATKFTSMAELFCSLDTPMMLKPVEFNLKQPRLEKLRLSFDDSATADVKFRVGGKLVYAHRTVLKLCNDHFRAMFENDWKESNDNEIALQSSDYTYESFRTFLLYLYTDRIEPPPSSAQGAIELLNLAHYYVEEDLKRRCEQQLKLLTTKSNVCEVYQVADKYKSKVLHEFVLDFIIPHLNSVLKTPGYKNMDDSLQKQLIQDLVKEKVFVGLKRKRKRDPNEGKA